MRYNLNPRSANVAKKNTDLLLTLTGVIYILDFFPNPMLSYSWTDSVKPLHLAKGGYCEKIISGRLK
jgi:hypothetical protein